jgi:hypothetical protein
MAKLKEDGEFTVEGTITMWLPLEPEEGERLEVNSSQTINPLQVWVSVLPEDGQWEVGTVVVKGRLYRKDNAVGGRWAERMYSGPLDKDFEGPGWVVALLEKEIPRRLSGRTQATEAVQAPPAPAAPVKEVSVQRSQFDSALRVLLMRENLDGTEWAIRQLRESADAAAQVAADDDSMRLDKDLLWMTLRVAADELEKQLDKRAAELATKEH